MKPPHRARRINKTMIARFHGALRSAPAPAVGKSFFVRYMLSQGTPACQQTKISSPVYGSLPAARTFPFSSSFHPYFDYRCTSSNARAASDIPILYSKSHEYLRFLTPDSPEAVAGISEFASEELGEVVFIEAVVPAEQGKERRVTKGDPVCTLEAVKSVAEVYAPMSGRIVGFNEKVKENPGLISKDPEGEGWIFKMAVDTPQDSPDDLLEQSPHAVAKSSLLSPAAYAAHVRREIDGQNKK